MAWRVYIDARDAGERRRLQRDVADAGWTEVSRPEDADIVLSRTSRSTRDDEADDEVFDQTQEALTPRELQVLRLLAEGVGNREIAERLGVSEHTVKFHLSAIFGKLGAATRTDAVRRALRAGLIDI